MGWYAEGWIKLILCSMLGLLIIGNSISYASRSRSIAIICIIFVHIDQWCSTHVFENKLYIKTILVVLNCDTLALPSSGIVRAVRTKEYPVNTPISIVFLAFVSFNNKQLVDKLLVQFPSNTCKIIIQAKLIDFLKHIIVGVYAFYYQNKILSA